MWRPLLYVDASWNCVFGNRLNWQKRNRPSYTIKRFRSYTDKTTGARMQIETDVLVKPWWFVTDSGKLAISVRYGSRVLELAPKKYAVEVAS